MPRKAKKATADSDDDFWSETFESPNDDYGFNPAYDDPLEHMSPEQIALLADYCQYLNAHDGFDPDNYEDIILEKERQLFERGRTKSKAPPPLYPPEESDESEESEEDEEPEEEEEEEPDEEIEENENNEDDNNEEN